MTGAPTLIVLGRTASLAGETGFGWVGGLAVRDGRVVAIGARHEVAPLVGVGTRVIELARDQIALPSITDAHLHLVAAALAGHELDLEGVPSLSAALAVVASAHAARLRDGDPDGWLLGQGWTAEGWEARPSAGDLERVAPGRRIALWAHDHHTRWLSQAALGALGIDATSVDPSGGVIGRDASGRPDGLLYEHAAGIGAAAIPRPDEATTVAAIRRYADRLAALGVTGVHDPGSLAPDASLAGGFTILRAMATQGDLPLRVHAGIRDEQLETAIAAGLRSGAGLPPGRDDPEQRRAVERYRVGWLKLFGDGSVGSRTAAMIEAYDDAAERPGPAGPTGSLLQPPARLADRVATAAESGIATMIHAIGDLAVRTALDAFGAVGAARLSKPSLMPRIEHAQLIHPDDVERFSRLGIAASVQPVQLRSDEATMRRAWGERADRAFPLAGLASAGAVIACGTDAPVEPPDPWPGIAMTVRRWAPEWGAQAAPSGSQQAIPVDRAIRAATVGPWQTAHEPVGGRLVVGAPADLVVLAAPLDGDDAEAAEALRAVRPLLTLLDGEERHRAPGFDR